VCPARVKLWDGWFRNFFSKKGIQIVEIEPQEHDRLMATIQSLRHIIITILGSSLMRSNFDLGGNLHISGQWFRMLIDVLRRQFQQPPQLYVDLLLNNPFVQEVSRALRRSAEEILNGIESGDKDLLLRLMDDVASYLKGHS
ncbi:MAG: prephenate dehydrogenase dimerization domain-containing protein, partial [Candidatus Bathyarchaeia archaeon]